MVLCCHSSCNTILVELQCISWVGIMPWLGEDGWGQGAVRKSHWGLVCARQGLTQRGKGEDMLPPALCISASEISSSLAALWFLFLSGSSQSLGATTATVPCSLSHTSSPGLAPACCPLGTSAAQITLEVCSNSSVRGQDHVQVPGSSRRCQKYSNVNQKSCQSGQRIDKVVTTKCFFLKRLSFWLPFFFLFKLFLL